MKAHAHLPIYFFFYFTLHPQLTPYILLLDFNICPLGYELNPFTCTCYGLVSHLKNWHEAKAYCERTPNYKLAVLDSVETILWFKNLRMTKKGKLHFCYSKNVNFSFCELDPVVHSTKYIRKRQNRNLVI